MNTNAEYLAQRLYDLLPATYRLQDVSANYPLRELVAVIAEQIAAVQEGLEQAYDDLFIETCAEWVVPYIGDLIGARPLHARAPGAAGGRTEVADTLGLRRRKGTLAALEQSARVVTGFPAVAVEFFTRLSQTQFINHVRPENQHTLSLRDELALERLDSAFDTAAHTLEVRRIASRRGKYNIQNIGLYLFRLQSYGLRGASASRVDDFRYTFSSLGIDTPLFNDPQTEISITQFAGPENVPLPVSRVAMKKAKPAFYGPNAAIFLNVDGVDIPESQVTVCNLSDKTDGSGEWAHTQDTLYGIDPLLGRIALPASLPIAQQVVVNYRYGFSDALGGGEYERGAEIEAPATHPINAGSPDVQASLAACAGGGVVEFGDSRSYALASAAPNLEIDADKTVEIRAVNGARPLVRVTGGSLVVNCAAGAHLILNGLLLAGGPLQITGQPASITLRHCTLVPGIDRTRQNLPLQPGSPVLIIDSDNVEVMIDRCIMGTIQAANGCNVAIQHSIIDATSDTLLAYSAGAGMPGGELTIENSTVVGRLYTQELHKASNVIFVSAPGEDSSDLPVRSARTQSGCVRFSRLPAGARTPRRHRCVSIPAAFTSLQFGVPGYCQLSTACAAEIRSGADDESEMGVFHDLYIPQRESDLRTRLDEYLRFGMEAGVFYAS